jgi:hypothetical protein
MNVSNVVSYDSMYGVHYFEYLFCVRSAFHRMTFLNGFHLNISIKLTSRTF